jgi:hypothetical protein
MVAEAPQIPTLYIECSNAVGTARGDLQESARACATAENDLDRTITLELYTSSPPGQYHSSHMLRLADHPNFRRHP